MKICQKCNLTYDDDYSFCSKCGTSLAVIVETDFCPYCGKRLRNDMDFCPYCGKNLRVNSLSTNPNYSINQSASTRNINTAPQYYDDYKTDSKSPEFHNSFSIIDRIKTTPLLRWSILVILYVINFIAFLFMDGVSRTYKLEVLRSVNGLQPKGNALSGGDMFLWILVTYVIFAISWFIINKLHTKAGTIFLYLIVLTASCNLIIRFFGPIYGSIIVLLFLGWKYFRKKNKQL